MNSWREQFEANFPIPDHDRYTKCNCTSEAEHEACFAWVPDREEVEKFIETEIIEKLIEDVATAKVEATKPLTDKDSRDKAELITPILQEWLSPLAKQLRAEWLGKETNA